jgi:phospholipase C
MNHCRTATKPPFGRNRQGPIHHLMRHGPAVDASREGQTPSGEPAPGTDSLPQIKHIVILMMQGHSFDNYLGMSGRDKRFESFIQYNIDHPGDSPWASLHELSSPLQNPYAPWDSSRAQDIQWDELAAQGHADPGIAMGYWTQKTLPYYYGLARTFPVAARWFSSFRGGATPNRRFLVAGTANGLIDDLPYHNYDYPATGTLFDMLDAHGITWANYHQFSRIRIIVPRLLGRPGLQLGRRLLHLISLLIPFAMPQAALRPSPATFTADVYPLGFRRAIRNLRTIGRFFADAAAGTLPAVSIVDPDFSYSSERPPQNIQVGERFAARVINSIMNGPAWPTSLLIWLYDNHGGYYDHVPPPEAPAPDDVPGRRPDSLPRLVRRSPFGRQMMADTGVASYHQLGFRVPAVVVSPYARPLYVSHRVYDHTSVLKLIERKWNLPPLTRRDAAVLDPLDMVDFDSPPAFLEPPMLPTKVWQHKIPPPLEAAGAFRIRSTRDLVRVVCLSAFAWAIGFLAFGGSNGLIQTAIVLIVCAVTFVGVRQSQFWQQWIFWQPQRLAGRPAMYNGLYALLSLTVFWALVSAALYHYGLFHLGRHPPGNVLWQYTAMYLWNIVNAVPWLNVTQTLGWQTIAVTDRYSEIFLITFRLLVIAPVLTVIVRYARQDKPDSSPASNPSTHGVDPSAAQAPSGDNSQAS